jgi:large conductance mechanosensitive channel
MLEGFRNFLFRGNVVELAVAVVIGAAFGGIVDGFIKGIVDPLLAMAGGGDIGKALIIGPFKIGLVISAIINFIVKAAVIYFILVRPFGPISAKMAAAAAAEAPTPPDIVLLTEIRDALKK